MLNKTKIALLQLKNEKNKKKKRITCTVWIQSP